MAAIICVLQYLASSLGSRVGMYVNVQFPSLWCVWYFNIQCKEFNKSLLLFTYLLGLQSYVFNIQVITLNTQYQTITMTDK